MELLYARLDLRLPLEAAHRLPYLQYTLSSPVARKRVRTIAPELAHDMESTPREVLRLVEKIRQCELPPRARRLIIDFSKTAVITNGCLNSKGAGIPNYVRKIFSTFILQRLQKSSFRAEPAEIQLVVASCISQSLQQEISKKAAQAKAVLDRKSRGKPSAAVLKEFKHGLLAILRCEYARPDGWRFPLFDREGKLFDPALFPEKVLPNTPVPSGAAETRMECAACGETSACDSTKMPCEPCAEPALLKLSAMDDDSVGNFDEFEERYYMTIVGSPQFDL